MTRGSPVLLCTHRVAFGELLAEALVPHGVAVRLVAASELPAAARAQRAVAALVDPGNPAADVFAAARRLARARPPVPVVFVAESAALGWIYRALDAGAAGYLSDSAGIDEVLRALAAARKGLRYFSAEAAAVISDLAGDGGRMPRFSDREAEVLRLLCDGLSTKEIALRLHLQPKTVDAVRSRLMTKAGVRNAAALVRFACDERFVDAHLRAQADPDPAENPPRNQRKNGV